MISEEINCGIRNSRLQKLMGLPVRSTMRAIINLSIFWIAFMYFVFGSELVQMGESHELIPSSSLPERLPIANIIELTISIISGLASIGLLAAACAETEGCQYFRDCDGMEKAHNYLQYALITWISGKLGQCVLGCMSINESRIIRPIMIMLATACMTACWMIALELASVPIAAGYAVIWMSLIALESIDVTAILMVCR